ncbi:MAG: GNAT family N-acetyltransferase [Acidimicrobiales bacterium]
MIKLENKTADEIAAWLPGMLEHYVGGQIRAGEDSDSAQRIFLAQRNELFPNDVPANDQFIMNVIGDDGVVGTMWIGRPLSGSRGTWFVFGIEIDMEFRGKGFGRAAMEAAEEWTRERNGRRLGLKVFGANFIARSLYDSLGYEVMATAMFKDPLAPGVNSL